MSTLRQGLLALGFATLVVGVPLYAQRKSNILTTEEIERANLSGATAYDLVHMLRPRWFSRHELARVPRSPSDGLQSVGVRVWLNGHNAGDADFLKTIPTDRVLEMRWYSANEAASRFGPTDDAAIEVVLKRGG